MGCPQGVSIIHRSHCIQTWTCISDLFSIQNCRLIDPKVHVLKLQLPQSIQGLDAQLLEIYELSQKTYSTYVVKGTHGETRILGTSLPSSAVIALLATLAIHCMARVVQMGLRDSRSFLMAWMISGMSSWLSAISTDTNR